jgi:hypothetical protein
MRFESSTLQATPLLCLLACTATWNRVVEYSPEPADDPVVVEVYRTVLAPFTEEPWPGGVSIDLVGDPVPLDGLIRVPSHWVDTLKHEVRVALSDPSGSKLADSTDIASAVRSLGLVLLPPDTTEWPGRPKHQPPPTVKLSSPGFNGDSTIAAVRLDVSCGPVCGSGETLLLARRPGRRWRVWYSFAHWIS